MSFLFFANFNECPLVVEYVETVKNVSLSTLSMSFIILKTSTRTALSLLYSRDGSPRHLSVSWYVKWLIVLTNFVALLCTFSIAIISFLKRGVHTVAAYSKWGLTIDLYKFRNISLSMYVKVLNTISRLRLALLILVLICSLNFNALSMITPRSFFTWYVFSLYLFLLRFHCVRSWLTSRTNVQVFTFLEIKKHFPNFGPRLWLIYTDLNFLHIFYSWYAPVYFCVVGKMFHNGCNRIGQVNDVNQQKDGSQDTALGNLTCDFYWLWGTTIYFNLLCTVCLKILYPGVNISSDSISS